jgi:hypothetical protein
MLSYAPIIPISYFGLCLDMHRTPFTVRVTIWQRLFEWKEMFISVEFAFVRIQLSLLVPRFYMAAAQPLPQRRIRLTGMTELASNCGDTYVDLINCSVRSELGFDVYEWNVSPSKYS